MEGSTLAGARAPNLQATEANLQSGTGRQQAKSSQTPGTIEQVMVRKNDSGTAGNTTKPRSVARHEATPQPGKEDGWCG